MLAAYLSIFLLVALSCVSQIHGHPGDNVDSEISSRVKRKSETFVDGEVKTYPEVEEIDLCENASVDALISLKDGVMYAFRGPYFWKIIKDKIEKDYPKKICDHWIGLPDYLDAAFTYKNDQIIFFKGSKYWKFNEKKLEEGYPKYIKEGFPGIPDDIQAVTAWGKKDFIYFFKGEYYWRYEPFCEHPVKKTYPKLIKDVWEGIPCDLDDAVVRTNGILYFLKGIRYWRFNDEKLKVETEKAGPFPALTAPTWFDCQPLP